MSVRGPRAARFVSRRFAVLAAMGVVGAVAACSLVVDSDRHQCANDEQCVAHLGQGAFCAKGGVCQAGSTTPIVDAAHDVTVDAPPADPAWACVDKSTQLPAQTTLHVFARYRSFADGGPIADLSVAGCPQLAINCSPPVGGTPKPTDADGLFQFDYTSSVSGGFRGTIETFASDAGPQFLPSALVVISGETNAQSVEAAGPDRPRHPTYLLTADDLEGLAAALDPKVDLNPEAGHIVFTALDCLQNVVADATVTADFVNADTRLIYLDENGKPSKDLKKTSSSGRGVFLNVTTGNVTVKVVRPTGETGVTQSVPSRKGAVSYTFLGPAR